MEALVVTRKGRLFLPQVIHSKWPQIIVNQSSNLRSVWARSTWCRTTTAWLRPWTTMLRVLHTHNLKHQWTWHMLPLFQWLQYFWRHWGLKDHRPSPSFPSFILDWCLPGWILKHREKSSDRFEPVTTWDTRLPALRNSDSQGQHQTSWPQSSKKPVVKPMNWMGWKGSFQKFVNWGMYRTSVRNHTQISVVSYG